MHPIPRKTKATPAQTLLAISFHRNTLSLSLMLVRLLHPKCQFAREIPVTRLLPLSYRLLRYVRPLPDLQPSTGASQSPSSLLNLVQTNLRSPGPR